MPVLTVADLGPGTWPTGTWQLGIWQGVKPPRPSEIRIRLVLPNPMPVHRLLLTLVLAYWWDMATWQGAKPPKPSKIRMHLIKV